MAQLSRPHSRIYMTPRSSRKLAAILWVILLLSAAVFLIFALLSAEIKSMDARQQADWADLVKSATDIERLRNIAENLLSFCSITGGTTIDLCRLAVGASFLIMSGSVIGLLQVRKMKRHLKEDDHVA